MWLMICCRQPSQATSMCAASAISAATAPLPLAWLARGILALRPGARASAFIVSALIVVGQAGPLHGDELVRITEDGKRKLTPVFVSKGNEIVYAVHESPNLVAIKR